MMRGPPKRERGPWQGRASTSFISISNSNIDEQEAEKQAARTRSWVVRWDERRRRHRLTAAMLFSTAISS
jgi:hypothetical protein